jgi:hypothetical protein
MEKIYLHNLQVDNGVKTYRLAVNNFTDMSNLEFRSYYNGLRLQRSVPKSPAELFVETGKQLPNSVD